MDMLYYLVPLALLLAGGFVFAFRWAARTDQFEDLETPAIRILLDDEPASNQKNSKINEGGSGSKKVSSKGSPNVEVVSESKDTGEQKLRTDHQYKQDAKQEVQVKPS